jgi:hypothetical protein
MKKIILLPGLLFMLLLSFNCSTPAYVEKDNSVDLSSYKTYMWVETRAGENDESKRATAYADISMHNAVNAELSKWGWRETTDNPDVYISYDVLVERGTETQQQSVYSQPFTRYYYNPYRRRWSTIYYPSQFMGYNTYETPVRDATITITMMDAETDKRIWQGWTTERLNGGGIRDIDVQSSVRSIFKESSESFAMR